MPRSAAAFSSAKRSSGSTEHEFVLVVGVLANLRRKAIRDEQLRARPGAIARVHLLTGAVLAIGREAHSTAAVVDVRLASRLVIEHVRPGHKRKLAATVGEADEAGEEDVEGPAERAGGQLREFGSDLLDGSVDARLTLVGGALGGRAREEGLDVLLGPVEDTAGAAGKGADVCGESARVVARLDGERLLGEEGGKDGPLPELGVLGAELRLGDRALDGDEGRLGDGEGAILRASPPRARRGHDPPEVHNEVELLRGELLLVEHPAHELLLRGGAHGGGMSSSAARVSGSASAVSPSGSWIARVRVAARVARWRRETRARGTAETVDAAVADMAKEAMVYFADPSWLGVARAFCSLRWPRRTEISDAPLAEEDPRPPFRRRCVEY